MHTKNKLINSYIWNLVGRFGISILSIISTLLLVRLLSPQDFGLVAIAVMVLGLFEVLSEMSIERYIVLNQIRTPEKINAAWSLDIIIKITVIIVAFMLAGPIANYYQEPELKFAIEVLSIIQVFKVVKNIGLAIEKMDMNFKVVNKILVQAKLAGTITTISLAFYFHDYRALIVGTFVNIVVETLLSYLYCSYRPKFVFKFDSDMMKFSFKLLLRNIFGYIRSKLDVALLGAGYGISGTGRYLVSQKFALIAQRDLIAPSTQPLFSELSRSKNKKDLFEKSYKFITLLNIFIFPVIFGINIISIQIETIVLGPNWVGTAEIIGNLSILMLPFSLIPILNNLFDHAGRPATSIIFDVLGISLILFCFYGLNPANESVFSHYRAVIGVIVYCTMVIVSNVIVNLNIGNILQSIIAPLISSMIMMYLFNYLYLGSVLNLDSSVFSMITNIIICLLIYVTFFMLMLLMLRNKFSQYQYLYKLFHKTILRRLK